MTDASGAYRCPIEVRWGDSDRLGHVNNAKIVEYLQEGRIKFFRTVLPARDAVVVRKMDVEFLRPVKDSSAPIQVETVVTHMGVTSFTVRQTIVDCDDAVCAVADTVLVGFDPKTDTARPLSDEVRAVLDRHRAVPA
ncbi:acyl-CoA thioesterase [Rhodococcus sp. Z13]|uniref:Acyl-CoA thioesterase n=1 Tax=Rhodococcus sacchari TaxID=2962047 RepID=A0ACD4DK69_9NOCA|nr:thioesterase family protein [Rhodococcus sp. Z13]UYP20420.1 acyl-CoA thioesterase [Rhodococcus sp. Z13]